MLSGWQVQAMKEAEDAKIWEELNAPDPAEGRMQEAAQDMKMAVDLMDKAEDCLVNAISELDGTPMEYKVTAFLDALMDLRIDIRIMAEKYEKGVRE